MKQPGHQPCIAAILAHADDLELECAGTFAKYIAQGYKGIYGVLSLCNSGWNKDSGKGGYSPSKGIIPRRHAEAEAAAKVFGAEIFKMDLMENIYTNSQGEITALSFSRQGYRGEDPPDGGVPLAVAAGAGCTGFFRGDSIDRVADVLIRNEPDIVICQGIDTNNPDHFAASLIVYKAHRKASQSVEIGPLYMSYGDDCYVRKDPDWIVDVTGHEEVAEKALCCHKSQGGPAMVEKHRKFWRKWGARIHTRSAEPFLRLL